VPYAVAVRNLLVHQGILEGQTVVFLDDLVHEKLITVFEGLKFSRTRTIFNNKAEHILPEIKRSVINFEKKLDDQKNKNTEGYIIVTNNKALGDDFKKIEEDVPIEVLGSICGAVDGLKTGDFNLKYSLPEEIIRKRREEGLKKRTQSLLISSMILGLGTFFYFYNQIGLESAKKSLVQEQISKRYLETNLNKLDPLVYRDALKRQKRVNYPLVYFKIANALPLRFATYSFGIYDKNNHWTMEEYLFTTDNQLLDDIPAVGELKNADIKDFWINNKPGKYLRVEL
jgi:hypothetical protein